MTADNEVFHAPLKGFYILDTGGVPVFARRYDKDEPMNHLDDQDAILLAGFLTAIELFSRTNLHGNLTDVGFENERYFFYKESNDSQYLLVVSASTNSSPLHIDSDQVKVIFSILSQAWMAFKMLLSTAESMSMDLHSLIGGFGSTLDAIILEVAVHLTEEDTADAYFETSLELDQNSQDIETSKFVERIEKVRNFFRR